MSLHLKTLKFAGVSVIIAGLSACGANRQPPSPQVIAAASNNQVIQFEERNYVVGVSPDRDFALVARGDDTAALQDDLDGVHYTNRQNDPENATLEELMSAAATATGCAAEARGGLLDFASVRKDLTGLRIFEPGGEAMRIALDCSKPSNAGATVVE